MAKRVITNVVFEDDLTGEEVGADDIRAVRFSYDGVQYEIDLTESSVERMNEAMKPFIRAARRTGGKKAGGSKAPSGAAANGAKDENKIIRQWARDNGHDVPERGRIPQDIRDLYEQAHAA